MIIELGHGSPGSPTATIQNTLAYELDAGPYEKFLGQVSLSWPSPQLSSFLDLLIDDLTEIQEEEYAECITLGFTDDIRAYGRIVIYLLHQGSLAAEFQLVAYFAQDPIFMPLLNSESNHRLRAENYDDQDACLFTYDTYFSMLPTSLAFVAALQIAKPDERIITSTFSSHPNTFPLIEKPFAQMLAGSVTHYDDYCPPSLISSKTEMPYPHYLADPSSRSALVDQLLAKVVPYSINVEPQVALMWLGEVLGV